MSDLMRRLRDARPTDEELDRAWAPDRRQRAVEEIAGRAGVRAGRRSVRWAGGLAAASLLTAAAVLPTVLVTGSSAREDLRALALVAAASAEPVLAQDSYLHVKTEALQRNSQLLGNDTTSDTNREAWIRWDGTIWAVDSRPSEGWREYHVFPRPAQPSVNVPTPEFAAALPSDPEALRRYLDDNVSGSNSHDEAIFVAVSDLARSHFLPPSTLSAALEVLADVDDVETREIQVDGHTAMEVSYSRFLDGLIARHTLVLDRSTARVISEQQTGPAGSYSLRTVLVESVDGLPDDVTAAFERYGGGLRVLGAP